MSEFAAVAQLIDEARHSRAFPGCAVEVGRRDGVLWQSVAGMLTYEPDAAAVTPETIFDLASLTKVIATTPVAMSLARSRRLLLTSPVAAYAPDWRGADRSAVTIADLLEHCAGLPAWWDLYRRGETRREFTHEISTLPLDSGRHCAADAEKPEKRCSGSPGLSTESGMTLKRTSARPPRACSVATSPPT